MSRTRSILIVAAAALTVSAAPASAVIHPKLVAPKNGHHVKVRTRPTFVVRDTSVKKSFNALYITISHSRKLNRCGGLAGYTNGTFRQMHRRKGTKFTYVYKAQFYDFPEFWLNRAGTTWYWQVYRIGSGARCDEVQSKIRKLHVVR